MARIVDVVDSHTIVVEEQGLRSTVHLAGVTVAPPDEVQAVEFLRRTTASGWVLVERDNAHPGDAWLFRSPDGLSVNGEMQRGAYRNAGAQMTWLGESDPGPAAKATAPRRAAARATASRSRRAVRRAR